MCQSTPTCISHPTHTHSPRAPILCMQAGGITFCPQQSFAAQAKVYMNTLPLPGSNPYPSKSTHTEKSTKSTPVDQKKACHEKSTKMHFSAFKSTCYMLCNMEPLNIIVQEIIRLIRLSMYDDVLFNHFIMFSYFFIKYNKEHN